MRCERAVGYQQRWGQQSLPGGYRDQLVQFDLVVETSRVPRTLLFLRQCEAIALDVERMEQTENMTVATSKYAFFSPSTNYQSLRAMDRSDGPIDGDIVVLANGLIRTAQQVVCVGGAICKQIYDRQVLALPSVCMAYAEVDSSSIAYARANRLPEALQTARQGLAMNPDFVPFHLSIASHYRQQRDFDAALRHLERAVTLNPHLGHAHAQLGRVLFALDRHDEAKAAFAAALRLAPQQSTTLFYLGMVEAEQQNWPQAIERFGSAVRLDPGFAVGHLYLARSLGEAGRIEEAQAALREATLHGALDGDIAATKRRLSERQNALR